MNCQRIREDRVAEKYCSRGLDPLEQDEFEAHILDCRPCLQSVELLQDMREALSERAHEIRVALPERSFRIWYWAFAAASLLVIIGIGVRQLRQRGASRANVTDLRLEAPVQPEALSEPPAAQPAGTASVERAAPAAAIPERKRKETAPELWVSPEVKGREASQTTENPPQPQVQTAELPQAVAQNDAAPVTQVRKQQPELTSEQAVELYKLAEVRPAPYSFSGFAGDAKFSSRPANGAVQGGGSAGQQRASFTDAMVAYVDGQYARAAILLESAALREPNAPDINFYRGVCNLLMGHPDESVPFLREVIQNGKSQFVQSAHTYLARAYLQKMNLREAEKELEAASMLPGSRKREATSLLERVRALELSLVTSQKNPLQ